MFKFIGRLIIEVVQRLLSRRVSLGFDGLSVKKYLDSLPVEDQTKRCGTCGGRLDE